MQYRTVLCSLLAYRCTARKLIIEIEPAKLGAKLVELKLIHHSKIPQLHGYRMLNSCSEKTDVEDINHEPKEPSK